MKKWIFLFLLLTGLTTSCGDDHKSSKNQDEAESNETNNGNNQGTKLTPKTGACPKGEFRHDHDGQCWQECREDSEGKHWCLKADEFPSDTDPEKKVLRCHKGLLHQDKCVSPIRYVRTENSVELYAGTYLKFRQKYNSNLNKFFYFGNGIEKQNYSGLTYRFPTKYPTSVLHPISVGGSTFGDSWFSDYLLTNAIEEQKKLGKPLPEAIQYDILGIKFDSFISFYDFETACKSIIDISGRGIYTRAKINTKESWCESITDLTQTCDQERKQCTITRIMYAW